MQKGQVSQILVIDEITGPLDIVHRLHEMGLHVGMKIKILRRLGFGAVTVVQYGQTLLALNAEEVACLRGHL